MDIRPRGKSIVDRMLQTVRAKELANVVTRKGYMRLMDLLTCQGYDDFAQIGSGTWVNMGDAARRAAELGDDLIYRIVLNVDGKIDVTCLGLESVDAVADGTYDDVHVLPSWVQERLALLMMTKADPPTHEVEGIGRRINQTIFWVYAPK